MSYFASLCMQLPQLVAYRLIRRVDVSLQSCGLATRPQIQNRWLKWCSQGARAVLGEERRLYVLHRTPVRSISLADAAARGRGHLG